MRMTTRSKLAEAWNHSLSWSDEVLPCRNIDDKADMQEDAPSASPLGEEEHGLTETGKPCRIIAFVFLKFLGCHGRGRGCL